MRRAGQITGLALAAAGRAVAPGVTTVQLDKIARAVIEEYGAKPAFLGYHGYPATINASLNDEVIHGIPGSRRLKEGDIVSIDVGAQLDGFIGDCAATFAVGQISPEAARLVAVTRQCFFEGLRMAREGGHLYAISKAVQDYAEQNGCSVVREFTGHGVGTQLHEEPEVPNFVPDDRGRGPRLRSGMCICIEPMVCAGSPHIHVGRDGWTVTTADGKLSAHYEHSVLITTGEPELLTWVEGSL